MGQAKAMSAVIVERVAEALYVARHPQPRWERLAEHRKDGYRETVQEVLLAAMNAGLAIREVTPEIAAVSSPDGSLLVKK